MASKSVTHIGFSVLVAICSLTESSHGQFTNYLLDLRITSACPTSPKDQTGESAIFKTNECTQFPQSPHTPLDMLYFLSADCGDNEVPNIRVFSNASCNGTVVDTFTARVGTCATHSISNYSVGIVLDEMDGNHVCTQSHEDELTSDDDAMIGIGAALIAGFIVICGAYVYYDKRVKLYQAAASTNLDTSVDEEQQMQLIFGEESIAALTQDTLRLDRGM